MACCDWPMAVEAVDHLMLHAFGMTRVAKQLDPTNDGDFVTITNRLRRRFEEVATPVERSHVTAAINELDVDWVNMTPSQVDGVVRAANKALHGIPEAVLPAISTPMGDAMRSAIGETKAVMNDRYRLGVGTSLNSVDDRVVSAAVNAQSTFARDVYGRRVAEFDDVARRTVADGLERGLRSPEVASNLASAARRINLERSRSYWQVVSSASMNRARTYGQLRGLDEARVARYRFDAVLDERTTNVCRMMDGKVFSVQLSLGRVEDVSAGGDVKDLQPWVRQRRRDDGRGELFVRRSDGDTTIGIVEESAVGRVDERGRFSDELTEDRLADIGVSSPPLHGLCRSTLLPVL